MLETFVSPQTSSAYHVVGKSPELLIAVRMIDEDEESGDDRFRVSIRGCFSDLNLLTDAGDLHGAWSCIKDGDHISVVTDNPGYFVEDAVSAINRNSGLFEISLVDGWRSELSDMEVVPTPKSVTCPNCGYHLSL